MGFSLVLGAVVALVEVVALDSVFVVPVVLAATVLAAPAGPGSVRVRASRPAIGDEKRTSRG